MTFILISPRTLGSTQPRGGLGQGADDTISQAGGRQRRIEKAGPWNLNGAALLGRNITVKEPMKGCCFSSFVYNYNAMF